MLVQHIQLFVTGKKPYDKEILYLQKLFYYTGAVMNNKQTFYLYLRTCGIRTIFYFVSIELQQIARKCNGYFLI